jgi:hypothetical protein
MVLEGRHHHGARASCGALDVRVWGIHNRSHGYQAADRNVLRSGDSDIGSGVVGAAAPHSHVLGKDSRAVNQQQRVLNRFIPEALLVGEKVRRERRWTSVGATPACELGSLHPVAGTFKTRARFQRSAALRMRYHFPR